MISVTACNHASVGVSDGEVTAHKICLDHGSVREGGAASCRVFVKDLVSGEIAKGYLLVQFKGDLSVVHGFLGGLDPVIDRSAAEERPDKGRIGVRDAPRAAGVHAVPRSHDAIVEYQIEERDRNTDVFFSFRHKVGASKGSVMTERHRVDDAINDLLGGRNDAP